MEDITLLNNTNIENTVKNNSLVELSNLTKKCTKCGEIKNKSEFYKDKASQDNLSYICRYCDAIKKKEYYLKNKKIICSKTKQYRNKNKDKVIKFRRKNYLKNKDKIIERVKKYYQDNKEIILKQKKEYRKNNKELHNNYVKKKYHSNPIYKIKELLRGRLRRTINKYKYKHVSLFLGTHSSCIVNHLESQFTSEMNWLNHGRYWHIDHIIPFAMFDLTNKKHQKLINHYLNLQPLSALENLNKRDNYNNKSVKKMTQEEKNKIINEFAAKVAAIEAKEKQNN